MNEQTQLQQLEDFKKLYVELLKNKPGIEQRLFLDFATFLANSKNETLFNISDYLKMMTKFLETQTKHSVYILT